VFEVSVVDFGKLVPFNCFSARLELHARHFELQSVLFLRNLQRAQLRRMDFEIVCWLFSFFTVPTTFAITH
jgi:hypothetical protein